jgi:Fe-S cluster assembly protein SufD
MALPSEKEEEWRYTPIDELVLDAYAPAPPAVPPAWTEDRIGTLVAELGGRSGEPTVSGPGPLSWASPAPDPATLGLLSASPSPAIGQVLVGGDALVRLNDAFVEDGLVIEVPAGVRPATPVVIVHVCPGASAAPAPAVFPRLAVIVGDDAALEVVEVLVGADDEGRALVVPVTEAVVGERAALSYVSVQLLGRAAWSSARFAARVAAEGSLDAFGVGLGGAYDRVRGDVALVGPGARSELRSAYVGTGHQVHDVRTLQDHDAPHTTSDLLCKGAVAGNSRSVYSGLIRVKRGAVRANALQTNHNLVLDERAHADSVPNLDIEENDVRCSHASTVGPVDEDQRYYLESRGVAPEQAERLIVRGFFTDLVAQCPVPSAAPLLGSAIEARLAEVFGGNEEAPHGR